MSMSRLWYKQPAKEWEEALPLGNGRMGAMIFGEPQQERIQVNEESMWCGGRTNRVNPDAKKYLPKIRKLIFDGRIKEAEKLMKQALSGCPDSMHPYQTLGDLYFEFEGIDEVIDYQRELDLEQSVYHQRFYSGDTLYKREMFLSKPDDVMVMHFTAEGKGKLNFSVIMRREKDFDGVRKAGTRGICLFGNLGKGGFDFSMTLIAEPKDGTVQVIGEHLIVEDATDVTLYFCADTTYHVLPVILDPSILQRIQDAEKRGFHELKNRHIKDYRELYGRVDFELEGTEGFDEFPTDMRIRSAMDGEVDTGLAKLYFDYGRYLLISCSREGGLPATLQGLWNKDLAPAWDSKYTININTEMNYWPAESCNLSECHMPLFDLIEQLVISGRQTADMMYGCRGFVCHHNTDIYGDTAPQDMWIAGSYWVMGAAWLCTHQWTHFEYTQDMDFLRRAFPVMREAALFFLDFLVEHDGYLVTCPSVSPENTFILPNGEQGANTYGVTMDNQILRDLFTQCIDAADLLGVDDELNARIKEARAKLLPTRIGAKGNIMEWPEEYEELEPGHRHISHLYGLYPSSQITMDGTPELAKAAEVTLERRLAAGGGHTGWSCAWIINHYARLWNGEKAYENLEKLFRNSTYLNLFDKHPPFQIDGNFGATAGIAEMLIQSNADRVVLLPALPKVWDTGHINGICIRGGAVADLSWEKGQLLRCSITAKKPLQLAVKYKDDVILVKCKAKETQTVALKGGKLAITENFC